MYPSSSAGLNRETNDAVYFFSPAFDPLNNYSAHAVEIWDKVFPTAEHAYQWKKFSAAAPDVAEKILLARSAETAGKIADENKLKFPATWHDEKVAAMEEILRAKLEQHDDVRDALTRTGNRTIVENSPVDSFWGAGPNGDGQNMVGKLWVKIRDTN